MQQFNLLALICLELSENILHHSHWFILVINTFQNSCELESSVRTKFGCFTISILTSLCLTGRKWRCFDTNCANEDAYFQLSLSFLSPPTATPTGPATTPATTPVPTPAPNAQELVMVLSFACVVIICHHINWLHELVLSWKSIRIYVMNSHRSFVPTFLSYIDLNFS